MVVLCFCNDVGHEHELLTTQDRIRSSCLPKRGHVSSPSMPAVVPSSVSIGIFLKKPDSFSIMPWQRKESLEARMKGCVSRIQENVLWVFLL